MILATSLPITEDQLDRVDSDGRNFAEGLKFRVADPPLSRNRCPNVYNCDQLMGSTCKGIWLCFMSGAGRCGKESFNKGYSSYMPAVRRVTDQVTAEGIGSFKIHSDSSKDTEI